MNCQRALKLIDPFVDGELDLDQARELRGHFRDCKPCHSARCNLLILSSCLTENSLYYYAPADLQKRILLSVREAVAQ